MIRLEEVTKIYPTMTQPRVVLDRVSVTLPTDRNVGILGRNGAGKSTLLRILARAEAPTSGRVRCGARLSWPMAFSGGFQANLSAIDNIRFVARIYGADWRRILDEVEGYAELGDYLRMPISTYSSGMRARLSLALSLAIRFEVYLVDEIPGAGDARFRRRFQDSFDALSEVASLILVSHSAGAIRRHCDVVFLLSHGRLQRYDDVEEGLAVYENE